MAVWVIVVVVVGCALLLRPAIAAVAVDCDSDVCSLGTATVVGGVRAGRAP